MEQSCGDRTWIIHTDLEHDLCFHFTPEPWGRRSLSPASDADDDFSSSLRPESRQAARNFESPRASK